MLNYDLELIGGFFIYLWFFCLSLTVFNSAPVRRNAKNILNTGKKIVFNGSHIIPASRGLEQRSPASLAPGAGSAEDRFSTDRVGRTVLG